MRHKSLLFLFALPLLAACTPKMKEEDLSLSFDSKRSGESSVSVVSFANNIASFSFANDLGPLNKSSVYKNSFTLTSPINQGVIVHATYAPEGGSAVTIAGNAYEPIYLSSNSPSSVSIQIAKTALSAARGTFSFHLKAITGDYTGREWSTSFSLERSNKSEGLLYQGEEAITFKTYVLKWNQAGQFFEDGPLSFGFVGDEAKRKGILSQTGSVSNSLLLSHPDVRFQYKPTNHAVTFSAELRITSNLADFPNLPKSGNVIKLPLSSVNQGGGIYSLRLRDKRYFSRKTLRLVSATDSDAFAANYLFVPAGLGKRKQTYTFDLVFTSVGKFLNQITIHSTFVPTQENYGSFADGDYYLHGGSGA